MDGFRVYPLAVVGDSAFDLVEISPEHKYRPHRHVRSEQRISIVYGEGRAVVGEGRTDYRSGDTFFIPKNVMHVFEPGAQSLLFSVSTPSLAGPDGKVDVEFE